MKIQSIFFSVLIKANANPNVVDRNEQSPLHLASKFNKKSNIVALLWDGHANVVSLDNENKCPMHYCNLENMEIFLSKINPAELCDIEKKCSQRQSESLWDHLLKYHPTCLKSYLNIMVTTGKLDLLAKHQYLSFDLTPFYIDTNEDKRRIIVS